MSRTGYFVNRSWNISIFATVFLLMVTGGLFRNAPVCADDLKEYEQLLRDLLPDEKEPVVIESPSSSEKSTAATGPAQQIAVVPPQVREDGYHICPGDLLEITVYQETDLTKQVRVSTSGVISLALIGDVAVAGLSIKEAEDRIRELLEKDFLVNPQVSVFIREYGKVSIVGEVIRPGEYELRSATNITSIIALAGGLRDNADPTGVELLRDENGTKKKKTVDLTDTDSAAQEYLFPGDIVVIKEFGKISILGEVARPGQYYMKKDLTVVDAIAMAGGFTSIASGDKTRIIREENGEKNTIVVPVQSILRNGDRRKDVPLRAGDTIVVPESFF